MIIDPPFIHASWRAQTATLAKEAVAANSNGGVAGGGRPGARAGDGCARKVTSDHGVLHNDSLASQHDVLGADESGLAGDLVARVLQTKMPIRRGVPGCIFKEKKWHTVSMYSPLGARLDMVGDLLFVGTTFR